MGIRSLRSSDLLAHAGEYGLGTLCISVVSIESLYTYVRTRVVEDRSQYVKLESLLHAKCVSAELDRAHDISPIEDTGIPESTSRYSESLVPFPLSLKYNLHPDPLNLKTGPTCVMSHFSVANTPYLSQNDSLLGCRWFLLQVHGCVACQCEK